jgi:hypothetical protein
MKIELFPLVESKGAGCFSWSCPMQLGPSLDCAQESWADLLIKLNYTRFDDLQVPCYFLFNTWLNSNVLDLKSYHTYITLYLTHE